LPPPPRAMQMQRAPQLNAAAKHNNRLLDLWLVAGSLAPHWRLIALYLRAAASARLTLTDASPCERWLSISVC